MYNFPTKCLGSIFRCTQPKQRTDQHSMWAVEVASIFSLEFSCQESSPLGPSFELVLPLRTSRSSPARQEHRDMKLKKRKVTYPCPSSYFGNFEVSRLMWTGGNFLRMSERTGPVEKGPIVSRHWAPLFLCSSIDIHQCVSVSFQSCMLVLPNDGQSIPLWVFQMSVAWFSPWSKCVIFQVYRVPVFHPYALCNKGWVLANVSLETRASINRKSHTCPSQAMCAEWKKSFILCTMSGFLLYLSGTDRKISYHVL